MLRRTIALVILMLPTLARGEADLRASVSTGVDYNSNVFRTPDNPTSEVLFRLGPRLRFTDERENLKYNLSYSVPYSRGIQTHQSADFDQFFTGGFTYRLAPRTNLSVIDRFSWLRADRFVEPIDDPTLPQVNTSEERILRNALTADLSHSFSNRLNGGLNFASSQFTSDKPSRRDVQTYAGTVNLGYTLSSKHRIGGGGSFTHQNFADVPERPGSTTDIYRVFASWIYQIDDGLTFSIRGGPAWIDTTQNAAVVVAENTNGPNGGNPFFFAQTTQDGFAPAAVDTDGDGDFDQFQSVFAPAGSLAIRPFQACALFMGTTPVVNPTPSCAQTIQTTAGEVPYQTVIPYVGANQPIVDAIVADTSVPVFTFAPPGPPPSMQSTTLTYFGTASIDKRWTPAVSSGLSYRRSESNASGIGGSTILDAVSARVGWRYSDVWSFAFRADWTKRTSVAPATFTFRTVQPVDSGATVGTGFVPDLAAMTGERIFTIVNNEIDTNRWTATALATRRLARNLDARFRVSYNQQSSRSGSIGSASDFSDFAAILGVTYFFDPMQLW